MFSRHKIRELAMQVLFLWDTIGQSDAVQAAQVVGDGGIDDESRPEALKLATEAWDARAVSDKWITRLAPQWPLKRQPGVDRSILRLAVHEMTSGRTPPKVVIDEAIELAKAFSTADSPAFVNGVLDAVLKEVTELKKGS